MVIKTSLTRLLIPIITVVIILTKDVECCSSLNEKIREHTGDEQLVSNTTFSDFVNHTNRNALVKDCPLANGTLNDTVRIIGGEEAPVGAYPWLALLGYAHETATGFRGWRCGGGLIGEQYILTAAHCVTDLHGGLVLSKIRLGEHERNNDGQDCGTNNLGQDICNAGVQDFDVEKIISHPNYNSPFLFQNDIAIVKIKGRVELNEFVKPICLPYHDDPTEMYLTKSSDRSKILEAWVAGWGATNPNGREPADKLQHIGLPIFAGEDCKKKYESNLLELENVFTENFPGFAEHLKESGKKISISKESQLCAGGEEGRDSCSGDSGSVLMTHDTLPKDNLDSWKFIGVVSFGPTTCGTLDMPGVYAKVRFYIDWILDNVEE